MGLVGPFDSSLGTPFCNRDRNYGLPADFFLCKGFQQYKYILIWFPVVLFGGRYYLGLMNGVRQMTVACVYVFLVKYIIERKPLPFLTGVLLLYGIHNSALLLLPTYLLTYIPFKKLPNRRILCLAILLVCFAIGQTPSLQGLFKYVEQILFITGYDNYTDFIRMFWRAKEKNSWPSAPL